jgi:hypothetical protein
MGMVSFNITADIFIYIQHISRTFQLLNITLSVLEVNNPSINCFLEMTDCQIQYSVKTNIKKSVLCIGDVAYDQWRSQGAPCPPGAYANKYGALGQNPGSATAYDRHELAKMNC